MTPIVQNLENFPTGTSTPEVQKPANSRGFPRARPRLGSTPPALYVYGGTFIKRRQVRELHLAAGHARKLGYPLNRFITIELSSALSWSAVRERASKWLQHRGLPAVWLWVLERSDTHGLHVHWLLHIPEGEQRNFDNHLRRQIRRSAGLRHLPMNTIKRKPINALPGLLRYINKNCEAATSFGIKPKVGGEVIGKRCGFSESLGRTARERFVGPVRELTPAIDYFSRL